jgi:hypothetical protein
VQASFSGVAVGERSTDMLRSLTDWVDGLGGFQLLLLGLTLIVGLSLLAAIVGAVLVRFGMRRPWVVRRASALVEKALGLVKRPLTIVVLDEVAAVIQTGHYTKNISAALVENHDELKLLVTEKVSQDPNVRLISRLPGYNTVVGEVAETTLRVLIDMLGDPRTDELINDLLRNNLEQIRTAVRAREHENVGPHAPADDLSEEEQLLARRTSVDAVADAPAPRRIGGPGAY